MKQLNTVFGIASFCLFLFYLTREVSPLETDLETLSSLGNIELFEGKIFLTITDSLSIEDIKTIQRIGSILELNVIDFETEKLSDDFISRPREPP